MTKENVKIDESYFSTLESRTANGKSKTYVKIEVLGYSEIGHIMHSILSVCRQALQGAHLPDQYPENLDYCRMLEIVQNLIPHEELLLLEKLHNSVRQV